ncbi:peptide chain release factor N(5)-glutamine methyltransferase [Candidatus Saccharibacteria bacterium]|nr:peptide chain release factor N(5)-glutamine methyltransferase [Candidatus Saccharibacteria bacterium]NIV04381.1 peptide chain release factor N(5)-glutamine methyltransferase [Calditrichia bacterium]NIS38934.1 peptide chain release factor N(5)-glutamine methyltransferase [Candidatus Saccharibacteria bacterium]NIV72914.1 peptide chain release factor N(5)-glutamine methyltransferase [Calditrichia bacterium]NIW00149.1 peptide chain release factor N(5)-glutamine methyltransferase [Candidatus Sacc
MRIDKALRWAYKYLKPAKLHSPELDAEVLLAHVLDKDRAFLFTHRDQTIAKQKFSRYKKLVQRRRAHEPIAYIIGIKYFYRLPFFVTKKVLIPRPESEMLVNLGLKYLKENKKKNITVIDVGTGSGAIVISLAKNYKDAKFIGSDNYAGVLNIARKNAQINRTKVDFVKSDLLQKFSKDFWKKNLHVLLIANLPYLPTRVWQNSMPDVKKYEPREALDGGKDGLYFYNKLIYDLEDILPHLKSFQAFWEINPTQDDKLKKLLKKINAEEIGTLDDLCGRTRIIGWKK